MTKSLEKYALELREALMHIETLLGLLAGAFNSQAREARDFLQKTQIKTDLIVVRPSKDLPKNINIPYRWKGYWYYFDQLPITSNNEILFGSNSLYASPTGRYEEREDGALAELWEIKLR